MDPRRLTKASKLFLKGLPWGWEDHILLLTFHSKDSVFTPPQFRKIRQKNLRKNKFNPSPSSALKQKKTHNEHISTSKFFSFLLESNFVCRWITQGWTGPPFLHSGKMCLLCFAFLTAQWESRRDAISDPVQGWRCQFSLSFSRTQPKLINPTSESSFFFFQAHWAYKSSLRKQIRLLDFYFVWPENQSPICEALYCYIHLQCTKITLRDCNAQSYFSAQ